MTRPRRHSVARAANALGLTLLLSLPACSALTPPSAQTIAGLSPDGTVTLDETFVTGVAEGSGTLNYQGQNHPFVVVGTVMGPGGGLSNITAAG